MTKYDIKNFPKVGSYSGNYNLPKVKPVKTEPVKTEPVDNPTPTKGGARNSFNRRDIVQRYELVPVPIQRHNELDSDFLGRCFWAGCLRGLLKGFL